MKVLVVDDSAERAGVLRESLEQAGFEVAEAMSATFDLLDRVEAVRPDVIVIDTESPSRDVLEHLCVLSQSSPRPIVMFTSDDAQASIREAVRSGVSAYVVDGLDPSRVRSIVEVACARFEEFQRLRDELTEANLRLEERKLVDRAKGILMKSRGWDEETAYSALRKLAMDRKIRVGAAAQQVIDAANLLGA